MIIHVVKPGESVYSISEIYNVSPIKIIKDNQLKDPNSLVVGQDLVILFPNLVHVVQANDTLSSTADLYNTSVVNLLQNNPNIVDEKIYLGEEIVISYAQPPKKPINVSGYAYTNIDRMVLEKTLPYLTYLMLFSYGITPEGGLVDIDDVELIQMAKKYGVAPIMVITSLNEEGKFSNQLASEVLNDLDIQNKLIDNIIKNIKEKGYYGLDVDFEYVLPEDKEKYTTFIQNLVQRLNKENIILFTALAPKISADQKGLLYEAHDYKELGEASNNVLLMTYEWGYTYGPPMSVAPIDKVKQVLNYAITEIPPEKIYMGIPNYGYDWTLPFIQGTSKAQSLSNVAAVELADMVNAEILYDETSKAPYFIYYDSQGKQHKVWFENARSIQEKLKLFDEYNFEGVGYWNLMKYFPQNWLVVNSLYDINKVL